MYDITLNEGSKDPFFYFVTQNHLTYYVCFRVSSQESYPLNQLYSLDFGEIDNKKSGNDSNISSTILEIIIRFLRQNDSIVLYYLCDNSDKRQIYRKRLFSKWFSICDQQNWIKYDYDFDNAEYNLSFIYNSAIYETELIESEILLTLDVLERDKSDSNL